MTTTCHDCNNTELWSRGLCATHYRAAHRGGYLEDYPTQAYNDNPDAHIRWAFGYDIETVMDIAIEFGYRLVPAEEPQ